MSTYLLGLGPRWPVRAPAHSGKLTQQPCPSHWGLRQDRFRGYRNFLQHWAFLFYVCEYFACMSVHHMPAWCCRGQKRASDPLGLEYRARNRWGQLCSSILNCLLTLCRPSLRARGCYCRPHLKLESSSWTGPSLSQHGPKCFSAKTSHIRGQCTYNQVPLLLLKGKEIISLFVPVTLTKNCGQGTITVYNRETDCRWSALSQRTPSSLSFCFCTTGQRRF